MKETDMARFGRLQQARFDYLCRRNRDGSITGGERAELRRLVRSLERRALMAGVRKEAGER